MVCVRNQPPYDNPLIGTWKLETITCKLGSQNKEFYDFNADEKVLYNFSGFIFDYSAIVDSCNVAAFANYSLDYDSSKVGTLNFSSINTNDGCSINKQDRGAVANAEISLSFLNLEDTTTNLSWQISGDFLFMDLSNQFRGSSEAVGCQSVCQCSGTFRAFTN